MEFILSLLANMFKDMGKKQTGSLIVFFFCALIAVWFYERNTANFRFIRIEKATQLLKTLDELDPKLRDDEHLRPIHQSIVKMLEDVVGVESTISHRMSKSWKFFSGLLPWLLFSFVFFFSEKKEVGIGMAVLVFGSVIGLITIFLPEPFWSWLNFILYLIVSVAVPVGLIAWISSDKKGKGRNENEKEKADQQKETTS